MMKITELTGEKRSFEIKGAVEICFDEAPNGYWLSESSVYEAIRDHFEKEDDDWEVIKINLPQPEKSL